MYCTNSTCDENFNLKLCTCAQSLALGTRTNFQIEILTINVISGVVYFRENILGSLRNVSETAHWYHTINQFELRFAPIVRHYIDVIMATMASQISSLTVVYSIVYSGADQRKHQSSASLAFVWGIRREFPAQRAGNTEMVPFDDVIMFISRDAGKS